MAPDRFVWVDALKTISILAVILLHCAAPLLLTFAGSRAGGGGSWWIGNLYDSAVRWSVPVFVMVSGALLLGRTRDETVSEFLRRRLARIAVPFFTMFTDLADSPLNDLSKMDAWRKVVPEIQEVSIPSSSGGEPQPALFYDSGSGEKKPLLVALHSWTADYQKQFSIPYGAWAVKNDWVLVHPEYKGEFDDPDATLSEAAVEDILDALDWAKSRAKIDSDRIYLTGFSGGAMAALTGVGRFPDRWTAAAAWVPVYDLVDWYETIRTHPDLHYAANIVASCGGKPTAGTDAEAECRKRSPSSYLPNARGHAVEVLITTGVEDWFVPPRHALEAFNALAEEKDRLTAGEIQQITQDGKIPEGLATSREFPHVAAAGREILGERQSGQATLWIFDGSHDVIYNAGLSWLAQWRR